MSRACVAAVLGVCALCVFCVGVEEDAPYIEGGGSVFDHGAVKKAFSEAGRSDAQEYTEALSYLLSHGGKKPFEKRHPVETSTTIGWQVHSLNDLREWEQWRYKGMRDIKIDPHYMDSSFCKTQGITDARGCFLLSHDEPNNDGSMYNSTEQLLALLATEEYIHHFKHAFNRGRIALCFKSGPDPCGDSQESRLWLALVDELFEKASALVSDLDLNLEFILDGQATPIASRTCLFDRWRPWNATWILHPVGALESNLKSNAWDRFQILNEPQNKLGWEVTAALGFGKFKHSHYPIQLWEPSDEAQIEEYSSLYLRSGFIHQPGFYFAINIDSSMFDVYSARSRGVGWHHQLLPDLVNPLTAFFPATATSPELVMVASAKPDSGHVVLQMIPSNTSDPSVDVVQLPVYKGGLRPSSLSFFVGDEEAITLLSFEEGGFALWASFTRTQGSLLPEGTSSLAFSSASFVKANTASQRFVVQVFISDNGRIADEHCSLGLQLWFLSTEFEFSAIGQPLCVVKDSSINSASVAAAFDPLHKDTVEVLVVSASNASDILAASVTLDVSPNDLHARVTRLSGPARVDVGTSPSVDAAVANNTVVFVTAFGDSFCYNSHKHNTEARPRICDLPPKSTPNVLAYIFGPVSSFKTITASNTTSHVNSCTVGVVRGVYDQGTRPSIALASDGVAVRLSESHNGLPLGVRDEGACGAPLPMPGVVLDAWELPVVS